MEAVAEDNWDRGRQVDATHNDTGVPLTVQSCIYPGNFAIIGHVTGPRRCVARADHTRMKKHGVNDLPFIKSYCPAEPGGSCGPKITDDLRCSSVLIWKCPRTK